MNKVGNDVRHVTLTLSVHVLHGNLGGTAEIMNFVPYWEGVFLFIRVVPSIIYLGGILS